MMAILSELVTAMWTTLENMAPYLLFGFAVAGVLSLVLSQEFVERHLGGSRFSSVFKAALFGVPLPLCSCSVVPVAVSLRRHGAGRGATMSFLLSTPQTGVDSIMVTYGLLGPVFAIFRPIAAFLTGIVGGSIANVIGNGDGPDDVTEPCAHCCCAVNTTRHPAIVRALRHGFIELPDDIGLSMLAGILIAGGIAAFVPDDFFVGALASGPIAMLVMMLLGIPTYVCATASVPIAAALVAKGVSPGAALVFLISGPATNGATIAAVWKMLGQRLMIVYLGTVAVTALVSGLLLDAVYSGIGAQATCAHADMLPPAVRWVCVAVLLVVLIRPTLMRKYRRKRGAGVDT